MGKQKKLIHPEVGTVGCPEPGCDSGVHPVGVWVNRGGDITDIDYHGTKRKKGTPAGRGALTVCSFMCEGGHAFWIEFHFHKGVTTFGIFRNPVQDLKREDDWPGTLWRD